MNRIAIPATIEESAEKSQPLLRSLEAKMKVVPAFFRVLGASPAALQGVLGISGALAGGKLDAKTRERIALAVANVNGCDYCNAAHSFAGTLTGLGLGELSAARSGRSEDAKADAAVRFARKVAVSRAEVSDADVGELRLAGYTDAEIVEIVVHVGFSTLTNYVNEVFQTPIDFPAVEPALRAA
jgi:uncharacterized peroxidase-related enzyme